MSIYPGWFSMDCGLAMDCGTLKRITYSCAAGVVLALVGMFFTDYEYIWIYSFLVSLIPASMMLTTMLFAVRCNRSSKVQSKETIVVGVKNAIDTLQLLELTNAGRYADPLIGTNKFCLQSKFMLFYVLTIYSILLLALPIVVPFWMGEDANLVVAIATMIFISVFLLAIFVEYYTCCKRKYPAKTSYVLYAKIVRCPWVSYIEFGPEESQGGKKA